MSEVIKRKNVELGDLRTTANNKRIFVLGKDIKSITLTDGTVVNTDSIQYRTLFLDDVLEKANFYLEKGWLTQESFDKRLQYINDKNIKLTAQLPIVD